MGKTKIEWTDWTLNPVVGCTHNCPYCYARKMAKRQKQNCPDCYDFYPHFHSSRLDDITPRQKPKKIFIDSMWDWNCKDNEDWWLERIIEKMEECEQHTFQILSKRPMDYEKWEFPQNVWLGATSTLNGDKDIILDLPIIKNKNLKFWSLEPIHADPGLDMYGQFRNVDWVIVGAETGNRKNKIIPKPVWINNIVFYCREGGTPIFIKNNIKEYWKGTIIQEFPKEGDK